MAERASGHEKAEIQEGASKRLSQAITWATPDSLASRFRGRVRSSHPEPILKYPHSGNITIAADYGARSIPFTKGYGLKLDGEERVYKTSGEIETLLARNGLGFSGKEEARQNEALLLHGIITHGESNRVLPTINSHQIEQIISQSHTHKAQTLAELDGKARVYFPFVPHKEDYHGAKMIQVITDKNNKQLEGPAGKRFRDAEINKAHELVDNFGVKRVLDSIPDHAVTLQEMSYGGVKYVQITNARGTMRLVNTVTGAEFSKTIDAEGREHIVHELLSEEVTAEILTGRKLMVVFGASGANAEHFSKGWKAQEQNLLIAAVGSKKKEGRLAKVGEINVYDELQFDRLDPRENSRLDKLLASGLAFAVYDSTPVNQRLDNLERVLPHLKSGAVERYVTTKPVARSLQDILKMKSLLRQQDSKGRSLEERFFVHEHYLAKGPLRAFLSHAEEVVAALGAPTQVEISIQEEDTAEIDKGVNRVPSLPDGLMQDLAPHAASISTLMQQLISNMGYDVSLRGKPKDDTPMLTKMRYDPTDFKTYPYQDPITGEQVDVRIETGFAVEGYTTIAKRASVGEPDSSEQHDLRFVWVGGKGLRNDKQVTITFKNIDPMTGENAKVIIDLNGNITKPVDAPASIQHLFRDIEGTPQDNGYGAITAAALLGDHPEGTFQNFHDASVVWIMEHRLKELSNGTEPYIYSKENRPSTEEIIRKARQARRGRVEQVA